MRKYTAPDFEIFIEESTSTDLCSSIINPSITGPIYDEGDEYIW